MKGMVILMNIIVFNGSPRENGNSKTILNHFKKNIKSSHNIEIIDVAKRDINPCQDCAYCKENKKCVHSDETNLLIKKFQDADFVVFSSPVYYFSITAQLKILIDKMHCNPQSLKNKKIGMFIVGGANTSSLQYQLIKNQFESIASYLNWEFVFYKTVSSMNDSADLKSLEFLSDVALIANAI